MPYCRNCGKEVMQDAKYCPNCGYNLQQQQQPLFRQQQPLPSGNSAGSARSLVLAAIIVQLVFLFLPIFFFLLFIPTSVSVSTATTTFTFGNATIGAISSPVQNQIVGFGGFALAGFILIFIIGFSVIWILLDYFLIYRNLRQPASYQSASTSAIVLGILQLIFGGIVPGILLIIAYIKINDALRYSTT